MDTTIDLQWCTWYPDDELIGMLRVHAAHPDFDRDAEMQKTVREIIAYLEEKQKELTDAIWIGERALSNALVTRVSAKRKEPRP